MPTVQFDGITLIRQNLKVKCESSDDLWVAARGEINDLEGYFCVMTYVGGNARMEEMPRYVKINVYAQAENLYSQLVTQFEVQLTSSIIIETKFRDGVINLNRNSRTQTIKVFSGSDFTVKLDYESNDESKLIKHQVTRDREDHNEYKLTLTVPNQVSHSFDAKVTLTHPYAKKPKILKVKFSAEETEPILNKPVQETKQTQILQEEKKTSKVEDEQKKQTSFWTYFFFLLFAVMVTAFLATNVCHLDLLGNKSKSKDVKPTNNLLFKPPKYGQYDKVDTGIRERKNYQSFSSYGGNVAGASGYQDASARASTKITGQRPGLGMHLDNANWQQSGRDSASKRSPLQKSIYSNVDDRSGFY